MAGLVAAVVVNDYRVVKAGDLLVRLQNEHFRALLAQAETGVAAAGAVSAMNQLEMSDETYSGNRSQLQ
jgi:multidrug resistance efflux pump